MQHAGVQPLHSQTQNVQAGSQDLHKTARPSRIKLSNVLPLCVKSTVSGCTGMRFDTCTPWYSMYCVFFNSGAHTVSLTSCHYHRDVHVHVLYGVH
jgi:hypothetical protein